MFNDDEIREILEMRERGRHEEAIRLHEAEQKGIEKGIEKVAINAYKKGQSIEFISEITGLSVKQLKSFLNII